MGRVPARSTSLLSICALATLAWVFLGQLEYSFVPPMGSQEAAPDMQRRRLLGGLGLLSATPAAPALAYERFKDTNEGVEFTYPTGLQRSENPKFKIFLRDVIEPLESVGLEVIDTKRTSLDDIGDAKTVAAKLLDEVVPKGAPKEIISAETKFDKFTKRRYDIIEYAFQWKFDPSVRNMMGGRARYQLHNKALITVANRRQYLVVASAEEQNWPVRGDQLTLALDTFGLLY